VALSFINLNLLDDLFEQAFAATHTDTEWTVNFTSGEFSGYALTLNGTGFTGDGGLPIAGTINAISLSGDGIEMTTTGLSLSPSLLLDLADLNDIGEHYPNDDEGEVDEPDDQPEEEEDDYLLGDDEDNDIDGGDGDDNIDGGCGDDELDGDTGNDELNGEDGDDTLRGGSGEDHLNGHDGKDSITCGAGLDVATGGAGHDRIHGGADKDRLNGGSGNDTLQGGTGGDLLRGGDGHDKFVFKAFSDSGKVATTRDVIADFTHGDRIDLSAMDANSHSSGNQRFSLVSDFTGVCGQVQADKNAKGFLVMGDVNGDKTADFSLQVHTELANLRSYDFIL
jgi:hypothetical protein